MHHDTVVPVSRQTRPRPPTTEQPSAAADVRGRSVEFAMRNSEGGRVIDVQVSGELDALTLPGFEERLLSLISVRQPTMLRLNLANVSFAGAGAVRTFVRAEQLLHEFGGELVLLSPRSSLRRVLIASAIGRSLDLG